MSRWPDPEVDRTVDRLRARLSQVIEERDQADEAFRQLSEAYAAAFIENQDLDRERGRLREALEHAVFIDCFDCDCAVVARAALTPEPPEAPAGDPQDMCRFGHPLGGNEGVCEEGHTPSEAAP